MLTVFNTFQWWFFFQKKESSVLIKWFTSCWLALNDAYLSVIEADDLIDYFFPTIAFLKGWMSY